MTVMRATKLKMRQKPKFGERCNHCGYCCSTEPCQISKEFLGCAEGPCIALETVDGQSSCGMIINPLGYIFKAAHPHDDLASPQHDNLVEENRRIGERVAQVIGAGRGCDSIDDEQSAMWRLPP